jgi:hypothetical protein
MNYLELCLGSQQDFTKTRPSAKSPELARYGRGMDFEETF